MEVEDGNGAALAEIEQNVPTITTRERIQLRLESTIEMSTGARLFD